METPYESLDPSSMSRFGEMPELQLDYDILNNSSYLDGYLDAHDFNSDFTLVGADVDSITGNWPEMNFFPDLNLPPYAGASSETDISTDMDFSQDTDNYWEQQLFRGFASGAVELPAASHEGSPPDLKHPCAYCPRSFRREGDWRKHLRIHTRPIQCPIPGCNGAFAQQRECDRHVESKHKSVSATTKTDAASSSSSACWTCGRSFARKDALKRHFARVHKVHVSFRSKSGSSPTTSSSDSSDQSETSPRTILSDR